MASATASAPYDKT